MPKKKVTEETMIKKQIRDYLRLKKWFVFHLLAGMGCYPGLSDLVAVKDGKVIFIEVKTKKGKLSENQINFKNDIVSHEGSYFVARGIEDLEDWA